MSARFYTISFMFCCMVLSTAGGGLNGDFSSEDHLFQGEKIQLDPVATGRIRSAEVFFRAIRSKGSPAERLKLLMQSLEIDPDSPTKLGLLLELLKNDPKSVKGVANELYDLAMKHPELPLLNLVALRATSDVIERPKLLKLTEAVLDREINPARMSIPERAIWAQIFSFYLIFSSQEGEFADGAERFEEIWEHRNLRGFESIIDNALIFFQAGAEKAPDHRRYLWMLPSRRTLCKEQFQALMLELAQSDKDLETLEDIARRLELYGRLGKDADGVRLVRNKIEAGPKRDDLRLLLGEYLFRHRREVEALRELRVVAEKPRYEKNARLRALMMECAYRAKAYKEAAEHARILLRDPKTSVAARYMLVNSLLNADEIAEGLREVVKLPNNPLRSRLESALYYQKRDYAEALSVLLKGEAQYRNHLQMRLDAEYYLAILMSAERMRDREAVALCRERLTALKQLDKPMIANALGYVMADLNMHLEEAEKLIRSAVKAEPDNYAYTDSLAWVLYRLKRYQEAEEVIAGALKSAKEASAVLLDHAGDIARALGKNEDAVNCYKQALARPPEPDFRAEETRKKLKELLDEIAKKPTSAPPASSAK